MICPMSADAPMHDWVDLAVNLPGAAARAEAESLRAGAPGRTLLARLLGVKTDERAWRIGAAGEVAVASEIQKLGPTWKALHAVPVGSKGSDIDHLLIGPPGVFTLNSKNHPTGNVWVYYDAFAVNGRRYPYIRNSRFEARRASKLLTRAVGSQVDVHGVVVVLGARGGFKIKQQPNDVRVASRKQLASWLGGLPAQQSQADVELIFHFARRSSTWMPT
jgi:hypothetical protein